MQKKRRTNLVSIGVSLVLCLTLGLTLAYAGDHLASTKGCTKCHDSNVRILHDYDYTTPRDCDICHVSGGDLWYLNEICADYLTEGGVPVEKVDGGWILDLPDYSDFSFDCKACHKKSFYLPDGRPLLQPGRSSVNLPDQLGEDPGRIHRLAR